jgi:hypothetical protein
MGEGADAAQEHLVRVALLERLEFFSHTAVFFDSGAKLFFELGNTLLIFWRPLAP